MDPEIEAQLNSQLAEMAELLRQQNAAMASQVKMMNDLAVASSNQIVATKKQTQTENDATNAITGNSKKQEASAKANDMVRAANEKLVNSLKSGYEAAIGFGRAMLDVTPGLSKYSESVRQAADTLGESVSGFGLLGEASGGLLGIFSSLVSASFKYSDAIVKGYDDVAKLGGAIGSSAEGILQLGHNAGLSSQNLEIFTKNAANIGEGLRNLGQTTSDGVKNFGKMIAVGDKTLMQYRKLGYSQDDLIEMQAKYVDMQAKAGADLKKSPKELRKASLKYVDELTALAEITGISVEKQQQAIDAALADENFQAYINHLQIKQHETNDPVEKARIQSIIDSKMQLADYAKASMGAEGATAVLQSISTDGAVTMTKQNAKLQLAGYDMQKLQDRTMQGQAAVGQLTQQMVNSNKYLDETLGDLRAGAGETSKNIQGIFADEGLTRQTAMKNWEVQSDADAEAMNNRIKQEKIALDKKKKDEDGAMARRAAQEAQERAARLAFDNLLKQMSDSLNGLVMKIMPMVTTVLQLVSENFDTVVTGAKYLGIALATLAAAAAAGKVVQTFRSLGSIGSAIKGMFGFGPKEVGSKGNPMVVKFADGTSALSSITGAGKSTSGPKIRQADLLDKNGNLLKGAALESRMKKLGAVGSSKSDKAMNDMVDMSSKPGASKVGGFLEGLGEGLKFIGKNAAPILEGTGVVAGAIVAIAAAVGIAGVILGKTLPSLAEGLKSFDGVNGKNLEAVGKGMAGLGAGILAMGGEGIVKGISAIADYFSGKEDESPVAALGKELEEFQKIRVNKDKVKYNAEAFAVFAEAMASSAVNNASGSIAQGIANFATGFFDKEPPFARFEYFSNKITVDPKKVKQNATAFKVFSEVMSSYKGYGPLNALGAIGTALADHAFKFFKARPPVDQFVYFATRPIDPKRAKANAEAFVDFANALTSYKPAPGAIEALSQWIGSKIMGDLFDPGGPIDNFDKFTRMDFGPNMEKNSTAFLQYAESQNKLNNVPSNTGDSGSSATPMQSGARAGQSAANTVSNAVTSVWEGAVSLGTRAWDAVKGDSGKERGIKPDVLGRKVALDKIMGKKLVITSGVRPGTANHGDGSAIDLGLNSNRLTEEERNKLLANAINLGFTGIGAEYRASGGPHIHLDTSHRSLTAWGSDYTSKSLMKDSPWLAQHVGKIKSGNRGERGGPSNSNTTITSGKPAGSINADSALSKLAKTSSTTKSAKKTVNSSEKTQHIDSSATFAKNLQLNREIIAKLDSVIDALENEHSTQTKILRHSMV